MSPFSNLCGRATKRGGRGRAAYKKTATYMPFIVRAIYRIPATRRSKDARDTSADTPSPSPPPVKTSQPLRPTHHTHTIHSTPKPLCPPKNRKNKKKGKEKLTNLSLTPSASGAAFKAQPPFRKASKELTNALLAPAALATISYMRSASIPRRSQKDIASATTARWTPIRRSRIVSIVTSLLIGSGRVLVVGVVEEARSATRVG